MEKLKVLSLFSGIGAFEKALTNQKIPYKLINFCEFDKFAIESYCSIHNVDKKLNLGNITEINKEVLPKNIDLLTHGSPCTDFSIAGRGEGGDKNSGTRSSLMWYSVDIIKYCNPKYVVWENVPNVLSLKHKHNFDNYIKILEEFGYKNYFSILKATDFGIPQSRKRIFCISIRKDINKEFTFPKGFSLKASLYDFLEKDASEKYYLSSVYQERFQNSFFNEDLKLPTRGAVGILGTTVNSSAKGPNTRHWVYDVNKVIGTLTATDYKQPKQIFISRTITCGTGRYYTVGNVKRGVSTLVLEELNQKWRLRKLTPRECFRLMGFSDKDYDKARYYTKEEETIIKKSGKKYKSELDLYGTKRIIKMSDSQLYKQAGNSIVVNVLMAIFENIFQ